MSWPVLLTISIISSSLETLLQRILLKDEKSSPVAYLVISFLIASAILTLVAILKGVQVPDLRPFVLNIILLIFLISSSTILWFRALKLMEASEFAVLWATRAFWSIITAIIFLQESFSSKQSLGALLIFTSVVLVNWKRGKIKFGKGTVMALVAAGLFGAAFTNDGIVLKTVSPLFYSPLELFVAAIGSWIVTPSVTPEIRQIVKNRTVFLKLLVVGIVTAVTIITYFSAYSIGKNLAQIAVINQTQTIVLVILAVIFLRERSNLWGKVLAAIISFIGVLLVR